MEYKVFSKKLWKFKSDTLDGPARRKEGWFNGRTRETWGDRRTRSITKEYGTVMFRKYSYQRNTETEENTNGRER